VPYAHGSRSIGSDRNRPGRDRRHDLAAQKAASPVKILADRYPDSPMTIRKEYDRAEERCAERVSLSNAVANAITEAYLRKKAYDDAKVKGDPIVLWAALQAARDSLVKAGDALSKHIEEHGCKS